MTLASPTRRLTITVVYAAGIVAVAPFLGLLRDPLAQALGSRFAPVVTAFVAVALAVPVVVALRRIRDRRWLRLGGCALAAVLVALQVVGFASDSADVSAVERVHIPQYGLLAVLLYWSLRRWAGASALALAALAAAIVGVLDELVQWLVATRVGELHDVWLNWAAVGTGLVAAVSVAPPGRWRGSLWSGARRAIGVLLAALTVLFALFVERACLGHRVVDSEEQLVFLSHFSAERLRELAVERERRWRHAPPVDLRPLSRQDYFLSEGVAHVQARNAALENNRGWRAWKEQRILERWYAPVLEQKGIHSGQPLGVEPWKRQQMERWATARPEGELYESSVLSRLRLRPSASTLWSLAVLVAVVGLLLAFRRSREP